MSPPLSHKKTLFIKGFFIPFFLNIFNNIRDMKKRQNSYRPSKISTSLLDQLVKIFRFEPSKTRREILKQRRGI